MGWKTKEKQKEYNVEYWKENKDKLKQDNIEYRRKNKDRVKQQRQIYYQKNKESIKKKQRDYNSKTTEQRKEKSGIYRDSNKEKIREIGIAYYENNKEKIKNNVKRYSETLEGKLVHWKKEAKAKCMKFDIDIEYLKKMPFICCYTGDELTLKVCEYNTVSLDRIDSNKHYTRDNVVLCCQIINIMKSTLSVNDFLNYCEKIGALYENKI